MKSNHLLHREFWFRAASIFDEAREGYLRDPSKDSLVSAMRAGERVGIKYPQNAIQDWISQHILKGDYSPTIMRAYWYAAFQTSKLHALPVEAVRNTPEDLRVEYREYITVATLPPQPENPMQMLEEWFEGPQWRSLESYILGNYGHRLSVRDIQDIVSDVNLSANGYTITANAILRVSEGTEGWDGVEEIASYLGTLQRGGSHDVHVLRAVPNPALGVIVLTFSVVFPALGEVQHIPLPTPESKPLVAFLQYLGRYEIDATSKDEGPLAYHFDMPASGRSRTAKFRIEHPFTFLEWTWNLPIVRRWALQLAGGA